jgi:peptidoglycan hydrolase-like protein with peptidoglycan-binding domain
MTQVKLNREKIIDFLVEQALEDMTVKQTLNERITTDDPKAQAILDKPYTAAGEEFLKTRNVPDFVLKSYKKGDSAEKDFWEGTAEYWNVSERELTHLVLALGSVVPVLGVPAALYDSLLYYEDYEKTKDPWKLLWAALAALSAIPGIGAALQTGMRVSKVKVAALLAKPGVSVKAAAIFSKLGARGTKMAQGLEAFKAGQLGETAARIPGISAAGKAKAIAAAEAAATASKEAKLVGAGVRTATAKAGKGVVAAMEAGKVAQAKKVAFMVADIEKWTGVAARTSPKLTAAIKAGKVKDIVKFEARLARNLARTGHSQSQINAALKAAGSTAKIKQVRTSVVALKAGTTNVRNVQMYNNMIKELGKAPGTTQQALKTLFKVEYSGVQAIGKLGKAGKAIPVMRIAYPIYAVITSDGNKKEIHATPPIAPDVTPEPDPKPSPGPTPKPGRWRPCPTNMKKGCGGQNVEELQTLLNKYYASAAEGGNYTPLKTDSMFGNRTNNVLINFQKQQKLKPDGIAGPATMKKLRALTAGAATSSPTPSAGAAVPGSDIRVSGTPDSSVSAPAGLGTSTTSDSPTKGKIDRHIKKSIKRAQRRNVSQQKIDDVTDDYDGTNAYDINTKLNKLEESKNMFSTLREHKQKADNETFDKLVKGLF